MKALIVEDDIYMNELLCELLRERGYEVENLYEGNDALEVLKKRTKDYNLLILDYNLNNASLVSGIDVYNAAKLSNPDVKAIMISAYGNKGLKERALKEGIDAFFDKPFVNSELLQTVSKLTARSVGNGR